MFQVKNLKCLVQLHFHLDGSINCYEARKLASIIRKDKNIKPKIKKELNFDKISDKKLNERIQVKSDCQSLEEFLEKFRLPTKLLITQKAVYQCFKDICNWLKHIGTMYAEIRFAPQFIEASAKNTTINKKNITAQQVVESAIKGINSSRMKNRCQLILCMMRHQEKKQHLRILNLANKYKNKGVCAIDVAGDEYNYPLIRENKNGKILIEMLKLAKSKGINITAHCGETSVPRSGNGTRGMVTLMNLGVKRIGHGVEAINDSYTLRKLISTKTMLEICPYSNCVTKVVSEYKKHPLKQFIKKGVIVSINTDDPCIINKGIKTEWQAAIDTFKLTKSQVEKIFIDSAKYSFASDKLKKQMIKQIKDEFNKKRS